jgi:hypothetical protein
VVLFCALGVAAILLGALASWWWEDGSTQQAVDTVTSTPTTIPAEGDAVGDDSDTTTPDGADATTPEPEPPLQTGNLSVASVPDGAVLEIDGRRVGTTPWQGDLSAGQHRLLVSRMGYLSQDVTVAVTSGDSAAKTLNLIPAKGDVTISANPGTQIYIDGEMKGTIPPVVTLELGAGRHELRYVIPDYAEFKETVRVRGGRDNAFSHSFPLHGTLRVICEPYAEVRLDGEEVGFTPLNIDKISEGEHRIRLYREGYQTIEQTIQIRVREINLFQFKLVPQGNPERR